ncbi:hypothetical protein N826_28550 [Skermanella aerolata KACC 11604]|nr:hypothetical protein N826_28550 [Skermanella aerolata KACC 11604]
MIEPAVHPNPPGPGQESVWSYPRPAIAEPCSRHIRILHLGIIVADTVASVRTIETSHPPSYYIPPSDIIPGALWPSARRSFCEWKGDAVYFDLAVGGVRLRDVAWSYPAPSPDFRVLRDYVAFYAGAVDECFVDGERVTPQPGDFYGGWITSHVAGPFKGVPGSRFW